MRGDLTYRRDECEFVRGTTKKDWTVDAWYRKRMSWCGYISWKLRKTKKTLSFWILKMALKIKSKIKKVLSNPRN
ncbi:MAG: hypothetical protein DRN90_00540 [Thermoproteota archaeon]|nr:MAG: hypothetical protein DRN90_00540 [Candidatus Korarchaeota archaeon]